MRVPASALHPWCPLPPPGMGTPGEEQASPTGLLAARFGVIIIKRGTQGEGRVSGDWETLRSRFLETFQWRCREAGGQESSWEEV